MSRTQSFDMHIHLLPAGGFAREVEAMLPELGLALGGRYDAQPQGEVQPLEALPEGSAVALAVGDSQVRRLLRAQLPDGHSFPVLQHPRAYLQNPASIALGEGSILTAGVILTVNIRLGRFVLLNLNSTIGHDCVLEDFVSLMPGVNLGGGVYLEEAVYLGTGATVLPGIRIGRDAVIGAGAVVTQDVPPGVVVKGVPGRW